jgi:hypothetical protein
MTAAPLRIAAFGIAALAVVDPAVTSSRLSRPIVAVVAADSIAHVSLTNRVAQSLDRRFTIVRGEFAAASATVVVGDALPDDVGAMGGPLIAVEPSTASPSIRLLSVEAPTLLLLNARSAVHVMAYVHGARGRQVAAQLRVAGVMVDQTIVPILVDSGRLAFTLDHVPASNGAHVLSVHARIDGAPASDSAFTVVGARDERLPVLFYDARPSWSSTFVRRAVQEDPRFSVTHRAVTSRGVSNTSGNAPASLRDPESLSSFATIVVGAPENLTASDVAGLETFMRRRGGRVLVLMEERGAGPVDRLAGVGSWRSARSNVPSRIADGALRGREFTWPATVPLTAKVIATTTRDSTQRPVVWSVPVGAGRLMMSGALDAWQHRGDSSGFNEFWTRSIADLSSSAPRAISVDLSRRALRPGEMTRARIILREPLLSNHSTRTGSVGVALVSDSDSSAVRVWPEPMPGVFSASIIAPRMPGVYRLVVRSGEDRAEASIAVDVALRTARHDDPEVVNAFVSSRGGSVIGENDLDELPDRVASAIHVVSRVETWHPMRSPWWIVPFALLLGGEWWGRRRRGLV